MYIVTTTLVKPDIKTQYYIDSDLKLKDKFTKFVELHNDILLFRDTYTNSDTSQTTVVAYEGIDAYEEFMKLFNLQFPTFFKDRESYNIKHSIELTINKEQL